MQSLKMIPINIIELLFALNVVAIIVLGVLVNIWEKYLPTCIKQTVRYGKFAYRGPSSLLVLEVPKSWFRHFYIYSSVLTVFTLDIVIRVYFFDALPPKWITKALDILVFPRRVSVITPTATVLAVFLLTIQCLRRVYDTYFVSVFGVNSRMNIIHYLIGFLHYTGCVLSILSSAPKFGQHAYRYPLIQISDVSFFDIIATLLFFWAWYHQYRVTVILGNLRKNEKGEVITQKHMLPEGDWFNYTASPHLFAEILMYLCLTVILWQNTTWLFIFTWVITNQVEVAILNHRWYKETFPNFPQKRAVIIPLIW